MPTRRTMLKMILGAGGLFLPWSQVPKVLQRVLSPGEPGVNMTLPSSKPGTTEGSAEPRGSQAEKRSEALRDVAALASPHCEGRKAGTAGEAKAAQYLMAQMQSLGLKPGVGASYIQAFTLPPMLEVRVGGRLTFQSAGTGGLRAPSANLLGLLPGEHDQEVVILSAHYDHLGIFAGELYPGANDNASGVACVLQVVRRLLQDQVKPKRTLVIAFWSAEEMGFLGSNAFVQSPPLPLTHIKAVVNLDTVGNGLKGDFILWTNGIQRANANGANGVNGINGASGTKESQTVVKALQASAESLGASAPLVSSGSHNSDQVSFTQVGIPAATLTTRAWLENNHTVKDVVASISESQLLLASEIVYQAISKLLNG